MHQSAEMCRKRGHIVLIGVVGLNLRRDDFFQKEISFKFQLLTAHVDMIRYMKYMDKIIQ